MNTQVITNATATNAMAYSTSVRRRMVISPKSTITASNASIIIGSKSRSGGTITSTV